MFSVIVSVIIISSFAALLALILVISEKIILNYGECKITINDEQTLTVEGGKSILDKLTENKIFIPSACGGRGTCGLCTLKVTDGAGPLLPTEKPFLDDLQIASDIRLSCQVKVKNDILLYIPKELLAAKEYICYCSEIIDLNADIKLFRFKLNTPDTIDYIPGQYLQLLTPVYQESSEEVYRAYSIASDPLCKDSIDLIIRKVPNGICTTWCFEYLQVGNKVKLNGPFGDFALSDTQAPIVFIAGGSGMAPINSILHQMKNTSSKRKAVYYFGANTISDLFLLKEMHQFENDLPDFRFIPVVAEPEDDQNWQGHTGLVTHAVQKDLKNAPQSEAYLCGSPAMIDAAEKVLIDLGMPEERIYYDKFA